MDVYCVRCAVLCCVFSFVFRWQMCVYTDFSFEHTDARSHATNKLKIISDWMLVTVCVRVCLFVFFRVFSFGNKKCDWKEVKFHMRYEISFQLKKTCYFGGYFLQRSKTHTHTLSHRCTKGVCADWICRNDMNRWWMATTKVWARLLFNEKHLTELVNYFLIHSTSDRKWN